MEREPAADESCANCGAPLAGPFCARCGQSAEAIRRPAWELIEHALETLFDFDARGFRSMRLLLTYPGRLTSLYLAGKRAPFVPPVRLYILTSVCFFIAIWVTGTAIFQFVAAPASDGAKGARIAFFAPIDPTPHAAAKELIVNADIKIDGEVPAWVDRLRNGVNRAFTEPRALNERLSELFPKMMFGLVPFFALLLWLLYVRRRRFLIEHVIFALHFHTAVFVLATLLIAIRALLFPWISGWAFFIPASIYLLVAMKRVYAQGWMKTAIKEALLLAIYGAAFGGAMTALVLMGLSEI
jgi:hypothetical protein